MSLKQSIDELYISYNTYSLATTDPTTDGFVRSIIKDKPALVPFLSDFSQVCSRLLNQTTAGNIVPIGSNVDRITVNPTPTLQSTVPKPKKIDKNLIDNFGSLSVAISRMLSRDTCKTILMLMEDIYPADSDKIETGSNPGAALIQLMIYKGNIHKDDMGYLSDKLRHAGAFDALAIVEAYAQTTHTYKEMQAKLTGCLSRDVCVKIAATSPKIYSWDNQKLASQSNFVPELFHLLEEKFYITKFSLDYLIKKLREFGAFGAAEIVEAYMKQIQD